MRQADQMRLSEPENRPLRKIRNVLQPIPRTAGEMRPKSARLFLAFADRFELDDKDARLSSCGVVDGTEVHALPQESGAAAARRVVAAAAAAEAAPGARDVLVAPGAAVKFGPFLW